MSNENYNLWEQFQSLVVVKSEQPNHVTFIHLYAWKKLKGRKGICAHFLLYFGMDSSGLTLIIMGEMHYWHVLLAWKSHWFVDVKISGLRGMSSPLVLTSTNPSNWELRCQMVNVFLIHWNPEWIYGHTHLQSICSLSFTLAVSSGTSINICVLTLWLPKHFPGIRRWVPCISCN